MINDQATTEVALKFSLDGAYLPIGGSSPHEVCPVCNGGSSNEKTFVIRRVAHDIITFRCYRASCGTSGCINVSNGTLVERESKSLKRKVGFRLGGFDLLNEQQVRFLEATYNCSRLSLLAAGVRVDADTYRIMLPLYDVDHELRGYALRWHQGISVDSPKPKALTIWLDETPRIAFPASRPIKSGNRKCLLLVEDWNSAHRLHKAGIPAAALLGTGLSQDLLSPIALSGYQTVVLCLDADAKAMALRHKLKYSSMFGNFYVHLLSNLDIKDMKAEEFNQFIQEIQKTYV